MKKAISYFTQSAFYILAFAIIYMYFAHDKQPSNFDLFILFFNWAMHNDKYEIRKHLNL